MEMEIKYYPEEPFKEVLDEMGVITSFDREEFFKQCNKFTHHMAWNIGAVNAAIDAG